MSAPRRPTPAGPKHGSRFASPGSPRPARPVRHTIAVSISTHTRAAQSSHPGSAIFTPEQRNLHTQAAQPFGQIPVFWQLAVSAGTPSRLGRHDPPEGYSKRPSRTRPAAASNSRAVEAKASRRLVTSVARGSESSAIQTDSTPPSVAARRAERSSNSAKSPS